MANSLRVEESWWQSLCFYFPRQTTNGFHPNERGSRDFWWKANFFLCVNLYRSSFLQLLGSVLQSPFSSYSYIASPACMCVY